jgi:hypothetical protein
MLIIVFAAASLAIVPTSPEEAALALAPFADERDARDAGLTADDYAAACQSCGGQEFSISALIEMGALDENGDGVEGVVVLRAA